MLVFSVQWSVNDVVFTGRVNMKLLDGQIVYVADVARPFFGAEEAHLVLTREGPLWMQINKDDHQFTSFFLQCLGQAIEKAIDLPHNMIPPSSVED